MRRRDGSISVTRVDLAALAQVLSEFLQGHKDKQLLLTFGLNLLQHKVDILEYAKLDDEEQGRLEELYRDVYKETRRSETWKKIFGFKRTSSIEEEARTQARKAVEDLKEQLHQERFAGVQDSLDQSEQLLEEVSREFVEAIRAGRVGGKEKEEKINRMRELLSGGAHGS